MDGNPCCSNPTLGLPESLQGPRNGDLQKKLDVMLHLEAEWFSKQSIIIANTILAEPGL